MASIISAGTTSGTALNMAGDTSGVLQLATNGSTTALTIDTSQNVGINTTAPAGKLEVNATSGAQLVLNDSASTGNGNKTVTLAAFKNGVGYHNLLINGYDLRFAIGGGVTEAMRIDASGNLLIGATSSYAGTEKLSVTSTIAGWPASLNCTGSSTNGLLVRYSTSPNNNGAEFFSGNDSTTARCYFKSNGGLANYSANNTNLSDATEKKNIELAGSYLDKICAIPVKTFLFNDQTDTDLNLGVIAQDVQAVAPELVMESNWAAPDQPEKLRLSIYQTDLQYALMKCIQEQQTIINDLKARITALEGAA